MAIKPLGDRVLAKVVETKEQKTAGGIYIPDSAQEKPQIADVIAVGKGRYADGEWQPLDVKTGDQILFGKYSGTEVKHEGQEYLILRESDILAKVEK
jgi:chaperonin GroES